MDLYAQELKVWKECKALREIRIESGEGEGDGKLDERAGTVEAQMECKVPGAFEW